MRICPKCRTAYTEGEKICPKDGVRTVDAREMAERDGDPLRGATIAGRFRIIERIGSGGMGAVYRAEQIGLGRQVALKILKKDLAYDRDTVTRFQREAKAMSLLTHPHTVRVFDFGVTDDGLLYLAMELLEGDLLTQKIERDGPMNIRQALLVTRDILASLAEAHSKGIVHRDLKPDNIFLASVEGRAEPVVKVLDFGIAKIVQGEKKIDQLETQAGTVFGTPRYMSPEQAQGKPLDPRSDLYSVGVLLYQMLVGHAPFVDDDAVVVMAKHIKEKPKPLHVAAPSQPVHAGLERLVAKALEKDANRRYASADEFCAAIDAELPVVDEVLRTFARSGRRPRRPLGARGIALLGGGLAAVAVVALLVALGQPGGAGAAGGDAGRGGVAVITLDDTGLRTGANTGAATRAEAVEPTQPQGVPPVLVQSTPPGADIYRGEEWIGQTPFPLALSPSEGVVRLRLRLEGHRETEVDVLAGTPAPIVELPEIRSVSRGGAARRGGGATAGAASGGAAGASAAASGSAGTGEARGAAPSPGGSAGAGAARRGDPYERFD
jgi:serine/threonine-protein kinase